MNRLTVSILFQYENTWSIRVVGIVFDNYCPGETVDEVANKDTVGGELLMGLVRRRIESSQAHSTFGRSYHDGPAWTRRRPAAPNRALQETDVFRPNRKREP